MKTTLERLEPTKVKLLVEVEPEQVAKAVDAAARELAKTVNVPGFRRGKVPRRVLETRLGKAPILQRAMEGAVGRFYAEALEAESVAAVAPPEIDLQRFTEEEGCAFEATVEVRPELDLPDHEGITVTFPEWEVADADVREQLEEQRERFAELAEVDRPVRFGDYVTIDLSVLRAGQPIAGATAEDALYQVGSGGVTPKLDQELAGAVAGQTLTYVDRLPDNYPEHGGEPAEFTVHVKDVRNKELPDLDDDFAATASEFDTLAELEEEIRRNLQRRKLSQAQSELRGRVLEAYLATVDVPLPETMVEAEKEGRLRQLRQQADQYGLDFGRMLELRGTTREDLAADLDDEARSAVKAQLVLEALAQKLGVGVASADLEREIQRHALHRGVQPREIARIIKQQGTAGVLVADAIRHKAIDALVAAADVEGAPPEELLTELGLVAEEPGSQETAVATQPHEPTLGGEQPPADQADVEQPGG